MIECRPCGRQTQYDIREVYDDETGVLRVRQTRLEGKLHSSPDGGPSHATFDEQGRPLLFEWHEANLRHKEDGPAALYFDPESGGVCREVFELHSRPRPAVLGPHRISRDGITGEVTNLRFAEEDLPPQSIP